MRKSVSILLISFLIFNSAGYILLYFNMLYMFRSESKSILNSNEKEYFTTLQISKEIFEKGSSEFYFVNEDEIVFNGKMYDIKDVRFNGNLVVLLCYDDIKESNLNEQFDKYFTDNLAAKSSKASNILNNIIIDAGLPISFEGTLSWREDMCFNFIFVPILTNFLEIPTPPPRNLI